MKNTTSWMANFTRLVITSEIGMISLGKYTLDKMALLSRMNVEVRITHSEK